MTDRYLEFGEPVEDSRGEDRVLSVRDALNALRRHWLVALCVLTAVVAAGMWHTLRQPRLYQASTTVRIGVQQAPIAGMPTAQTYDYRVDRLQSEQQVIRSQEVAERVVDDLGLRLGIARPAGLRPSELFGEAWPEVDSTFSSGDYLLRLGASRYELRRGAVSYGSAPYGDTLRAGGLALVVPTRPAVDGDEVLLSIASKTGAARALRSSIGTRMLPQTDIVEVTYTGTDPRLVRDIANSIAEQYAAWTMEGNRQNAERKSTFIAQQLSEQETRLATAQDALKNFKEQNQISSATAEATALFESISRFEDEKQAAVVEQNVYQELLGKLSAADTVEQDLRQLASTEALAKNSYVSGLYTRWFELQQQREETIAQNRTPMHESVRAIDRLITDTKLDLQAASESYLRGIQSRIESLNRTIASLRQQGEKYPSLEAQEARLGAAVSTAQATYANLQTEYNLALIAEQADGGTVRILDVAQTPNMAISPNRRRALLTYLALGVLLAIAASMLVESLDNTVKSPDELTARFELPVLGLIPVIRNADVGATEGGPTLTRLVTHADPRSPVAEAYRSLRTNIAYAKAHQDLRTIVLTSPGPADGKSTTAANLAISFAQQGQRTLLIDADLRRAVLDGTFDVTRSPGLTDVLVGNAALAEAVRTTEVPGLSVLPSGQFPPNPSELLGSPAMQNVLHDAQGLFDIVLFDTPPLLAVTDAAVLSTMVDGTILVVRMGATTRDAVRQAAMRLRNVRARVLGAVLNDMSHKAGSYYGGYGAYTYYAYYGSGDGNGNGQRSLLGRIRQLAGRSG
jgi:tyrosine-protein kinase Etk/Wzc